MHKNRTISKILKLKSRKKMELELEVKKASDRVDEESSKLHGLEKDYKETLEVFADKSSEGAMNASNINSYYDFFSRINGKINDQKIIHDQRKSELKSVKNNLVEAHKDKKAFEILNDKAVKKDIREKLSLEQKEADFFAITRRSK
ncbi:MAG: flagellar export protein FliJ [Nitrospirae bacterium]|nr:flagellar export protein FliJ [Nitrospirota bacterium]